MIGQWSLVVLLLVGQARANPWHFGEDHPNFRVIYQIQAHIKPFTYNTRQILTIPPCMTLKYVWVRVSNTLGFTPTATFHKTINVVSIVYGLLQYTGSDYSIVAKGFRTAHCNPGIIQGSNNYIPFRQKGTNVQKVKKRGTQINRPQRKGQNYMKAFYGNDGKKNGATYDQGSNHDSEDKYDSIKESYEEMSKEFKEVGNEENQNYMIIIVNGKKSSQQVIGEDRGSGEHSSGDDHDLDYGNSKDYDYKGSKYVGVGEYVGGTGHAKDGGFDRGRENANGGSYRDSDSNKHTKQAAYSTHKNYMSGSYDGDSESNRHNKEKNSIGYVEKSGYGDSSNDGNDKGGWYGGDIGYIGGSSGLDDEYIDGFDIGNKKQSDSIGKEVRMYCNDYLRTHGGNNLAVDNKVIDYCLVELGMSMF